MKALNPGGASPSIAFPTNAKGEINAAGFKAFARKLPGIGDIGIVPAESVPESQMAHWHRYIAQGHQAGMQYLERNIDKRADPRSLLPEAKSLIVILCPYRPPQGTETNPHIALYAQGKDYHKIVKDKLFLLASCLPPTAFRAFCDTAPLLEKYWAWRAGLGHIGRNTLLIHPRLGSFCFIGILLTRHGFDRYDQALPFSGKPEPCPDGNPAPSSSSGMADKPSKEPLSGNTGPQSGHHPCLQCQRCLQACPGHALDTGLDARRCFSYLTIEHKGERPPIPGPYWFGCDICQNVCPANRLADTDSRSIPVKDSDPGFLPLPATVNLTPSGIADMAKAQFDSDFHDSALHRAGLDGLQKNILSWQKAHAKSNL